MVHDQSAREQVANVLCTAYEILRFVAVLAYPVLPLSMEKLWRQLGLEGTAAEQQFDQLDWDVAAGARPAVRIGKADPIFPRLDKASTLAKLDELAEIDRERDKPKEAFISVQTDKPPESQSSTGFQPVKPDTAGTAVPQAPSPQHPAPSTSAGAESPKISIEDFAKVEMRTGEIKAAERIPGATKLLKLQVDIGTEVRQVCAGIAEYYEPEKLIGMKVVIVVNLQPRKMRGVESNGMIVAASIGDEGRPVLVTFNEDVPNGARLR
jgi:methionyl-tRNA synthetase